MKQIGVKVSFISKILDIPESAISEILREIEGTPFKTFYRKKGDYYFGHVIEAIKYYTIVKNHK